MSRSLPNILSGSFEGQVFWAFLFCYTVVFPLTLARKVSVLRFASLFSFICGVYVVLVLVFVCLCDRDLNQSVGPGLKIATTKVNVSLNGIFSSFPLVVFSFMYQPNLPGVYQELKDKSLPNMWKVICSATLIAVICYSLAGFFGYATFANYPNVEQIMEEENILKAPY